jgi:hypothetical protein
MRFLVMVKATKDSEAGVMPSEQAFAEMGKYNEELVKSGILLAAEGLQPTSKGVRVRFSGGKRTVLDGPFTESKEFVAGFSIWKVKSMEEAIEWVKRSPVLQEDAVVEIRQIMEWEDFGLEVAPERQERKAKLRAEFENQSQS